MRWYRVRLEQYGKPEDRERFESLLSRPNMSLHLYTLARKYTQKKALDDAGTSFLQTQREIEAAKAGR